MINPVKHQTPPAEEICLRRELFRYPNPAAVPRPADNCFGDEIIRLMRLESTNRAQLKAMQRIEASLRYMMQNLNKPVKVPVLSAMVGLSESSFFALFKSATGRTPLDFFIRARMQRAGELLAGTTLQIKAVAARLGYDDQFYFSRLFKAVHGISPREYRSPKEGSNNQTLKPKPAIEKFPAAFLPRLVPARENQMSERVLIGGYRPAPPRAKAFPESCGAVAARPHQTSSVSVHQ